MNIYAECPIKLRGKADAIKIVKALDFFGALSEKKYPLEDFYRLKTRFSFYSDGNIGDYIHALYNYIVVSNEDEIVKRVVHKSYFKGFVDYFSDLRWLALNKKDSKMENQMVLSVRFMRMLKELYEELEVKIEEEKIKSFPLKWQGKPRLLSSLHKARCAGLLDENYMPTHMLRTNEHVGYLVHKIAEDAGTSPMWKEFEQYWGRPYLSQYKNRALFKTFDKSDLFQIDKAFE